MSDFTSRKPQIASPAAAPRIFSATKSTGYCTVIKQKGAMLKYEPKDWPYGTREFMVVDLDGNQLAFGCESVRGRDSHQKAKPT
ncbi:MAG TPA: hypothetical protein VN873_09590 [Candidatus Angelobacter sp.]|nr:hypothetical protein [Candidatus Angelobacter sp.]